MADTTDSGTPPVHNPTTTERTSDRELVVRRTIHGPARLVFEAWTNPALFQRWWVPKSFGLTLLSCELDVRVGGQYRLVFQHGDATMAFFGTYLDVTPPSRLVWTNDEGDEGQTITTVTFEEVDGRTALTVHDLYPSKEALDAALESGSTGGLPDQLDQLEELLASVGTGADAG
jgi:uncharacterized protein YndB with AHSA1/START domain